MALPSSKSQIIIKSRSLRQLVEQLEHPTALPKKEKQVLVDMDEVRRSMKKSWRGGDSGNKEFGKLEVLKNKMLSNWQIQRMQLSKRSYSTPKESKGYRFDPTSKEFAIKDEMALHSKPFQHFLSKVQEEYENRMLKIDSNHYKKAEVLQKMSTTGMKFGKTSNLFGLSKGDGFRTLKSFKSQIGIKNKF